MKQNYEWLKIDVFYSTLKRIGWKSHSTRSRAITFALLPAKSWNVWRNDLPLPEICTSLSVGFNATDIAMVPMERSTHRAWPGAQRGRTSVSGETWFTRRSKGCSIIRATIPVHAAHPPQLQGIILFQMRFTLY